MLATHCTPAAYDPIGDRDTIPIRILVGSAGSPSSMGAVQMAAALAASLDADVHVVAATTPLPYVATMGAGSDAPVIVDEDNRRQTLQDARRQLDRLHTAGQWSLHSVVGWPAESILEEATAWGAAIIVIGVGRHQVADRLVGAETAVAIARRSPIPVIAVPAGAVGLPSRVLAATDFSEASITAARIGARLMAEDGTLVLAHVTAAAGPCHALEELAAEIREHTGRRVNTELLSGTVVDALLRYAREESCDMISVGGRPYTAPDGVIFGSVRTRLLRAGSSTVLIAPSVSVVPYLGQGMPDAR